MTQQGARQQSFRTYASSSETYEGDTHSAAETASAPGQTYNERLLGLANATMGTNYTNLNAALQAWAEANGAHNWSSTGEIVFGLALAVDPIGTPDPQTEGAGNNVTFRIRATQALTANATCDVLTVDDTALAGQDYTKIGPPAQQVTIPVNPGYVDVQVALLGPVAGWAPDRRFFLDISNPGGNAGGDTPTLGNSRARGNITDSLAEPTVAISVRGTPDPVEQNDTTPTTQTFTVTLTGITTHDVLVPFSTRNGSATAGSDYTAKSETATITAGQTSVDIVIDILAGATVTAVEDYFVDLGDVTTNGHSLTKTNGTGQGRIKQQNYLAPPLNLVATGATGAINLTWDDNRL